MQNILIAILMLVGGFVLLVKGADFFVDGSSSVARRLKVPSLIIGMTIVAMGTSLPELSVSVVASMNGSNSLAVSNVVGSNLFNLMVVLGASALLSEIDVSRDVLKRDYPFSVACTVLLLVLGIAGMRVGHLDGLILLALFVAFLAMMVKATIAGNRSNAAASEEAKAGSENGNPVLLWLKDIVFIIGGAVAIKFGGDFVVNGAVTIARGIGVTETLIGLTIVACGTSLPELVTSLVAAKKKELDMAVGNVVGSNIFNVLLILGTASAISPITFLQENIIDIAVLLASSVLTLLFCMTKQKLTRREGAIMLLVYAAYLVYICVR